MQVERDGSREQPIVITLEPALSGSARLLLPESVADEDISDVHLYLRPVGRHAGLLPPTTRDRDAGGWNFRFRGYPAGEYQDYVYARDSQLGPVSFELARDALWVGCPQPARDAK